MPFGAGTQDLMCAVLCSFMAFALTCLMLCALSQPPVVFIFNANESDIPLAVLLPEPLDAVKCALQSIVVGTEF